jgi:hypothetical protein
MTQNDKNIEEQTSETESLGNGEQSEGKQSTSAAEKIGEVRKEFSLGSGLIN